MWLFFFNEKWLIVSKYSSHNIGAAEKTVVQKYFAVYTNNKWGVIDSQGTTVIEPKYDETIIIPNTSKAIFICTYDVDYEKGLYKTKVLKDKKEEVLTGYESEMCIRDRIYWIS